VRKTSVWSRAAAGAAQAGRWSRREGPPYGVLPPSCPCPHRSRRPVSDQGWRLAVIPATLPLPSCSGKAHSASRLTATACPAAPASSRPQPPWARCSATASAQPATHTKLPGSAPIGAKHHGIELRQAAVTRQPEHIARYRAPRARRPLRFSASTAPKLLSGSLPHSAPSLDSAHRAEQTICMPSAVSCALSPPTRNQRSGVSSLASQLTLCDAAASS